MFRLSLRQGGVSEHEKWGYRTHCCSLDDVITCDYGKLGTASEFKRWLRKQGCTFSEGTRHTIVYFGGRSTMLPRHPSKEVAAGTVNSILRRLGLRLEK